MISKRKAMTQQRTYIIIAIAIIVIAAGVYTYYNFLKPKPPTEMQVWVGIGSRELVEEVVKPIMLEEYNVELFIEEGLSAENLAKAVAEKDNPVADVFFMDEGPFKQAKELGLCHELTVDNVPNLNYIPQKFKDPDSLGAPVSISFHGLWYDYDVFDENGWDEPDSWYDLWDERFKDRVVIPTSSSTWSYMLFHIINGLEGGDIEENWEPGFAKLKELVPNLHSFSPRSSNTMTLVERDEAWIGNFGVRYAITADLQKGITMAPAYPKEGVYFGVSWMFIPDNAPHLDLAYKFLNIILSDEYQAAKFRQTFQGSVNPKAYDLLSESMQDLYPFTQENIDNAKPINWDVYAERKDEFIERWSTEIETQ
jgi:putative spermidine/putrescine transport system substrate-binding protein